MSEPTFFARFVLAWASFFRILFDGAFAARVIGASSSKALDQANTDPERAPEFASRANASPPPVQMAKVEPARDPNESALQLLSLLQREGRLVDFIEQDIAAFPDADVGAAARVVHEGCRKALRAHVKVAPVRSEEEGSRVTLANGFRAAEYRLTGNVRGEPPFHGTLRHKGWKALSISLPTPVGDHDGAIVAPAEVEL